MMRWLGIGVMLAIGWQVGTPIGLVLVDALGKIEREVVALLRADPGPVKGPAD